MQKCGSWNDSDSSKMAGLLTNYLLIKVVGPKATPAFLQLIKLRFRSAMDQR